MNLQINTERLLIRPLTTSDLDDFLIYRSNPAVTKYQGFDVMNRTEAQHFIEQNMLKTFGQKDEWIQMGVENKENKQLIGDCAFHFFGHEEKIAEIGLTISHLEQQKGFAKEAFAAILNFLFEERNVLRVQETTDAENTSAIQLLKSLGFREEGHFIENIFFKGKWGSEYQFALLKKEWNDSKK